MSTPPPPEAAPPSEPDPPPAAAGAAPPSEPDPPPAAAGAAPPSEPDPPPAAAGASPPPTGPAAPPARSATAIPRLGGGPPGEPRWAWWQALLGFLSAMFAAGVAIGLVYAVGDELSGAGAESRPPWLIAVAGLVQAAVLIGTAAVFAGMTRPPRLRDFGFRSVPFWPAVGWSAIGFIAYFLLSAVYAIVFHPEGEQSVGKALGLERGTAALIAGGFVVIVMAPLGEETFFRGFLYPALRNSFGRRFGAGVGIGAGALIAALLFAAVHYTDPKTVPILPVLALLGVVFALVYEVTRSLYTTIGMHAIVNFIAFVSLAKQDDWIGVVYVLLVLTGCALAPRLLRRRAAGGAAAAP